MSCQINVDLNESLDKNVSSSARVISKDEVLVLLEALTAFIKHGEQHAFRQNLSELA